MNSCNKIKYSYYVKLTGHHEISKDIDQLFDPASMSKVFYAYYLFSKFSAEELNNIYLQVSYASLRKYGRGTRKLRMRNVFQQYSLLQLVTFALQNSCNVSTGMLADYCGREQVNNFIANKLELPRTSINSKTTNNVTTVQDLVRVLEMVAEGTLLSAENHKTFLHLLSYVRRRSIIRNNLSEEYEVLSKGGTTFSGLRRDMALIYKGNIMIGLAVIVQSNIMENKTFNKIDKILAKFKIGELHKHLIALDNCFQQKVKELLTL